MGDYKRAKSQTIRLYFNSLSRNCYTPSLYGIFVTEMLAEVQCRKIFCHKCQEISCVESEGEIKTKGNTDSNVDLDKKFAYKARQP
jgi:hypothetical protein